MSTTYDDGTPWLRRVFGAIAVIVILGIVTNSFLRSDGSAMTGAITTATSPGSRAALDTATATAPATRVTVPSTSVESDVPAVGITAPATVPTDVAATSAPRSTNTPAAPVSPPTYPTGPDGSPLPVLVVYGETTVTLSGAVPTVAASDRLAALAAANSQRPLHVVNDLVVNEHVPLGVGVRVIELDSPRFEDGRAELLPEHAAQFDRVAAVMQALPNVSALVIGHADQRGAADQNWQLSDERARSVVAYLTAAGIEPSRLSSRAAGETDLLSVEDDVASLALNRRTEFVFYGVLIE